ncbi:molybdopterin-guanine dinucleotide biosynthesis protein A [Bacillus mesophilus]|uniref:NTP transferase domain-containing protein n=1 Tax=Bacillus mesophilus TaxID=1808955 RepID=A0A6M0QEL9_9BACI|nr:NTP transferase domain-containing protein [Bacillus mesophilus]MBM7660103.1 molybdopterin-guanine dinucleotide biosynthesis protein A [Bacillus mesophilus]NEY73758.1 NTP transferase domain-containing protein [Bacillus mesophilus]
MLTGVILAGGKKDEINGTLKSFLPFKKERVIDYQINEMKNICSEIMIITSSPMPFLSSVPTDIRILTDYHKGKGILGGMFSALSLSKNPYHWVVGCGMPFISSKAAMYMFSKLEKSDSVAVMLKNHVGEEPLHGIYNETLLSQLQQFDWSHDNVLDFLSPLPYLGVTEDEFIGIGITPSFAHSIKSEQEISELAESNLT